MSYLTFKGEVGGADLHPGGLQATAALMAALALQPEQRLLEIGCGTAVTAAEVVRQTAVTVDGIEPLPAMLAVAQRRLRLLRGQHHVRLYQGSGLALPMAAEQYDRVYCESVLGFQTATSAQAMLREVWRVLRPQGLFVANEAIWREGVSAQQTEAIYEQCMRDFGICQASPQPWALPDWVGVMEAVGFEVVSAVTVKEAIHNNRAVSYVPSRLSKGFTRWHQLKGKLVPQLRRQRRDYQRLLAQSEENGRYIQSYLFVLRKSS